MVLSKLNLSDFRNIEDASIEFNDGINILYGDNAQGKTNILESIYFCATGRSYRTKVDNQLIAFDRDEAHIKAFVRKKEYIDRIDVHIKKDKKKGIAVNGVPVKKSGDLFGTLYVVIFSPEDLQLIKNSPIERRRFIDLELCQLSSVYYYDLQQYYKVLKQRNNLLKNIGKNGKLKETLFVWDNQLIDYGKRIIEARIRFAATISEIAAGVHKSVTEGREVLEIVYKPNCFSKDFEKKLRSSMDKDIIYGNTSVGPHKDDILFYVNGNDVKIYGSQGQQRTAALSAKLAEIEIIREKTGDMPLLLLDDVLSELDENRQFFLLQSIKDTQTVITCTGIEDMIKKYTDDAYIFEIKKGKIALKNKS